MRIVLISPKGPLYRHRGGIFKRNLRYAPLTLTTLAALVPAELGAHVEIIDEGVADVPDGLEADLVGMTVITGTAPRAYQLAKTFRQRGIPVVLGGPHVTLLPHEATSHGDAIVTGYAEQSWPDLLRDFAAGCMTERYDQEANFSLDRPVFAHRDLLNRADYLTTAVFEATRSCAHACDFCVAPAAWGRKQFQKPVAHVVEDIRRQGARKIIFIDLNLISDKRYAKALFEALIPLKIRWFGLATTLIVDQPELLELMARSGCTGLLLGLESVNGGNLSAMGKGFNNPDRYVNMVRLLHDHGISVMGCFVFGLDGDTPAVFDETVRLVNEAAIDLPRFAISTPFPGTPLHHRLDQEGRILTRNWELYDGQHVVFQPRGMTVRELAHGHERAWKAVYGFASMARRIGRSRIQIPLSITANLGYRFYAHNLHRFYSCDWFTGQREDEAA